MGLTLLAPAALAALLAVLVPLVLHLRRRPRQHRVDFAALRWIAVVQRPQRRRVFEERLLLLLRMLLLAVLALLLATPVLQQRPSAGHWVAVVPGADLATARSARGADPAQRVWLAPGFPGIDEPMPGPGPTASLVRELDASLPAGAALSVVVPSTLHGLDGARLALGREVDWIVSGNDTGRRIGPRARPTPVLSIRFPAERERAARVLEAGVAAWQIDAPGTRPADFAEGTGLPGGTSDTLAWLHPGPLPEAVAEWVAGGRTLIVEPDPARPPNADDTVVLWRSADGDAIAIARRLGAGRVVEFARPLEPGAFPALLDPTFPRSLLELLLPARAPDAAPASAHAPLRTKRAIHTPAPGTQRRPLLPWLAMAVALLLLAERILATRSTRWTT